MLIMVQDWTGAEVQRPPRRPTQSSPRMLDEEARAYNMSIHYRRQPPMEISEALQLHCGIEAKQAFVAVTKADGSISTFMSPGRPMQENNESAFFNAVAFQRSMRGLDQPARSFTAINDSFYAADKALFTHSMDESGHRQPAPARESGGGGSSSSGGDGPEAFGRKRHRGRREYSEDEDQDPPPLITKRYALRIGDSQAVYRYYEEQFKQLQQTACKLMAKAWVKVIEPKKQSTYPYTGNEQKAPPWWPKPWGDLKDDRVRHKEPDHLYKKERIHLLIHILRVVMDARPEELTAARKLELNVRKLEEASAEVLSSFYAASKANAEKKINANGIFQVARLEERYKNGGCDAATEIYVTAPKSKSENRQSDGEATASRQRGVRSPSSRLKQEDDVSHNLYPHMSPRQPGSLLNDLPVRNLSNPSQNHMMSYMSPIMQQHNASPNTLQSPASGPLLPMNVMTQQQGAGRRDSIFQDFNPPSPPGPIYPQGWATPTSAAGTAPLYPYANNQLNSNGQAYINTPVSTASSHQPAYLQTSFASEAPAHPPIYRQPDVAMGDIDANATYGFVSHSAAVSRDRNSQPHHSSDNNA